MNASTTLARSIVRKTIEIGVKDVVLSPGSRSASLAIALYEAELKGLLTIHVRIDERTAAFLALGIAKAVKRPVAILCTSGTAVANYHPAILEARHSQVPLLVLTADRPERLRRTGANQTTLQTGIFGKSTPFFADIWDPGQDLSSVFDGLRTGPVHINVQFDEPLLPDGKGDWLSEIKPGQWIEENDLTAEIFNVTEQRGLVIVGHDRGGFDVAAIEEFVAKTGWPLLAEDPMSFPRAIAHSSLFLTSSKVRTELRPRVAVVIGRTTLSRSTNALIKSCDEEVVIDPRINSVDSERTGFLRFSTLPEVHKEIDTDITWLKLWESFAEKTHQLVDVVLKSTWTEPEIATVVVDSIESGTTVYVASSRPVRDIEAFASPRDGLEVFANRGLAGIDGNISTAIGIATRRKRTLAIMGDLSFLHDLTGLIGSINENIRILVIDNDGGGIFSTLPQAEVSGFEKIFGTPHGKDLTAIAGALGVKTTSASSLEELLHEMSKPIEGLSVVVAKVPSRDSNAALIRSIYQQIEQF